MKPATRAPRLQFFLPGELPLVLLALVAQRPRHGYELMTELDRLFGPAYRASAGSVYPALAALVEEGLLVERRVGPRREYSTTATGRSALTKRRSGLSAIEVRTGVRLQHGGGLNEPLERLAHRVRALEGLLDAEALDRVLGEVADRLERTVRERRGEAARHG